MRIKILVTGGCDKEYNEFKGELFFKATHLPETLRLGCCKLRVDIKTLMMVDSLCMTDADRKKILENCKKIQDNKKLRYNGGNCQVTREKIIAFTKIKFQFL